MYFEIPSHGDPSRTHSHIGSNTLRAALFPFSCHGCGGALSAPPEFRTGICGFCISELSHMVEPVCSICGISLTSEFETCLHCRVFGSALPGVEQLRSCLFYSGTGAELLRIYKGGGSVSMAWLWAELLLPCLESLWEPGFVVVGVPASPRNRKRRGYDQMRRVVNIVPRLFPCTIIGNGIRRRGGLSQKSLNRSLRSYNLVGRMTAGVSLKNEIKKNVQGVILVDDVCTTGATLSECALALTRSGIRRVKAITLFRD